MLRDADRDDIETARRPLLVALAAGGAAGLAGCSSLVDTAPVGDAAAAQTVTYLGRTHEALGDAVLDLQAGGDELLVDNLVTSSDGVRAHFDGVDLARVFFDGIALPTSGTGFFATGAGTGGEQSCIGNAGCQNNGGSVQASAGFSCLGSSTVRIVVWDGNTIVGRDVVSGGSTVATVSAGPNGAPQIVGCGYRSSGSRRPGYQIKLDVKATITTSSGDTFVGDGVELLADRPTVQVSSVDQLEFTGPDLGSLTIVDESVQ